MTQGPSNYKPGDIANGHVLTGDGRWVALNPGQSSGTGGPPGTQHWGQSASGNNQPVVFVQTDNSNNTSLAPVTSLVCGLIGLFFSWIPIIGIIGWVFGPLALVFGALGLRRGKAEHKIMSWIGLVCGAITLVICLVYAIAFSAAISQTSAGE